MVVEGERLLDDQGCSLQVEAVTWWLQEASTHNFEVADWHTYFVAEREGASAVWVHNGPGEWIDQFSYREGEYYFNAQVVEVEGGAAMKIQAHLRDDFGESKVRGEDLFRQAKAKFMAGGSAFDRLRGEWTNENPDLRGTLNRFNSAVVFENMPEGTAALDRTFMGKMAKEMGWRQVEFIKQEPAGPGGIGFRSSVTVDFKPLPPSRGC